MAKVGMMWSEMCGIESRRCEKWEFEQMELIASGVVEMEVEKV